MDIDIVIALKDRSTLLRCISTLIAQIKLTKLVLGQILICDGGSHTSECKKQLQQVSQLTPVKILARPHTRFNKGWLLNQGIEAATASVVLVSDVDILWQANTLEAIATAAANHPNHFYCVKSVQESEINTVAVKRSRYAYSLSQTPLEMSVKIYAATSTEVVRPGCGLVCARRDLFWQVGGYRHCFWGWGWEDQDLLLRAQLLQYSVAALGRVTHLSHGDALRNAFELSDQALKLPQQSRDRNILTCLKGLSEGKLMGDLPHQNTPNVASSGPIRVHYPPQLTYAAHLDYALPRSPQAPD
jgi:glycosyltransferase involved in cell wall biosynthesis